MPTQFPFHWPHTATSLVKLAASNAVVASPFGVQEERPCGPYRSLRWRQVRVGILFLNFNVPVACQWREIQQDDCRLLMLLLWQIGESGRTPEQLEKAVAVLKKMVEKTRAENERLKKTPAFTSADQLEALQKENTELKVWLKWTIFFLFILRLCVWY